MPIFFFDVDDGDGTVRDDIGTEYPDVHAARSTAIKVLPDIAKDVLPDGDRRTLVSRVRDQEGMPIFQATLSLIATWLIEPPTETDLNHAR